MTKEQAAKIAERMALMARQVKRYIRRGRVELGEIRDTFGGASVLAQELKVWLDEVEADVQRIEAATGGGQILATPTRK